MTLSGYDIANVNGSGIINRALGGAFVILKATEGLGFVDQYHNGWAAKARALGKLVGHYHYAHLANSPTAEADFFVDHAGATPGEVMVLDFEPYGQNVSDGVFPTWIVAFTARVNARTGAHCWVYLNDDMASRVTRNATPTQLAALHALPLWKARYSSTVGSLFGWPAFTAWQYSGTGIDADVFYGDANAWRATGVGGAHLTKLATPAAATPTAPPAPQEDPDMKLIQSPGRGIAVVGPDFRHGLTSMEEVDAARLLYGDPVVVNDRQFDVIVNPGGVITDNGVNDDTLAARIAALSAQLGTPPVK